MSVSVSIEVGQDDATPKLKQLLSELTDLTRLNASIATEAENLTRDYLIGIASSRHKTANRLGASPSGHLELAAESVTSSSDENSATVSITSPGMSRAFRDITITPGAGKTYLTIPATAEAYGRRAGSFSDLRLQFFGKGLLGLVKAEQSSVATRQRSGYSTSQNNLRPPLKAAGRGEVFYWLKKSVEQKQDRSLLPSDALYAAASEEGAISFVEMLISATEA